MTLFFRNCKVLPMTAAAGEPNCFDGYVGVEGRRIALVTADAAAAEAWRAAHAGAREIDGRGGILMPGLVNTHCHMAMTLQRSYADDMALMEWLNDHIWPFEARQTDDDIRVGALLGAAEMLLGGVTSVVDMYWSEAAVFDAVDRAGMRALLCASYLDTRLEAFESDLPALVARGVDGATTVTTTMIIAHMAGIKIFATGGIGGVHRGAETTMDISADLEELAQTPVRVVCAGAKSILDLGLTLEYLETKGVPVIGYGTGELPAFYTRKSGFSVDYRVDSPEELAEMFRAQRGLEFKGGMLVTNPIPEEYSMDKEVIDKAIDQALAECKAQGVHGKETTPFLLARVVELTGGDSLESNIQLVLNNARLAARTACALAK